MKERAWGAQVLGRVGLRSEVVMRERKSPEEVANFCDSIAALFSLASATATLPGSVTMGVLFSAAEEKRVRCSTS